MIMQQHTNIKNRVRVCRLLSSSSSPHAHCAAAAAASTALARIQNKSTNIRQTQSSWFRRNLSTETEKPKKKKRRRKRAPRAAVNISENAASRLKALMKSKPNAMGVTVGVKARGCNGMAYTLNYTDKEEEKNFAKGTEIVEQHGIKVIILPEHLFYVVGTEMDFIETDVASEFTFVNPNAKGACGCGESMRF